MKCPICTQVMELIVPDDDETYLKCPSCGEIHFLDDDTIWEGE